MGRPRRPHCRKRWLVGSGVRASLRSSVQARHVGAGRAGRAGAPDRRLTGYSGQRLPGAPVVTQRGDQHTPLGLLLLTQNHPFPADRRLDSAEIARNTAEPAAPPSQARGLLPSFGDASLRPRGFARGSRGGRCQLGPKAFEPWAHPAVRGVALSPEFKQGMREPLRRCGFSERGGSCPPYRRAHGGTEAGGGSRSASRGQMQGLCRCNPLRISEIRPSWVRAGPIPKDWGPYKRGGGQA